MVSRDGHTREDSPGVSGLVFLTSRQVDTLTAVVDRVFPGDGSASASELGVVAYIDGQLAGPWGAGERLFRQPPFRTPEDRGHGWQSPLTPSEAYQHGLAALDRIAHDRYGGVFAELAPAVQDQLLHACEADDVGGDFGPGLTASAFFALLLTNVMEGLFADPRYGGNRDYGGWRWLGFPETVARYADDGMPRQAGSP
jgi:gluconate 2-dehydrogenase gamma chain